LADCVTVPDGFEFEEGVAEFRNVDGAGVSDFGLGHFTVGDGCASQRKSAIEDEGRGGLDGDDVFGALLVGEEDDEEEEHEGVEGAAERFSGEEGGSGIEEKEEGCAEDIGRDVAEASEAAGFEDEVVAGREIPYGVPGGELEGDEKESGEVEGVEELPFEFGEYGLLIGIGWWAE
jgi:hypothetical protein